MMLWKDNYYFLKCDNSLKEEKLNSVEVDCEKRLETTKAALELFQDKYAKAQSEADASQKKVQELEHSLAQLTSRIDQLDSELAELKNGYEEEKKAREDNKKVYQKMVARLLKAYRSECCMILSSQNPNFDFSDLERLTPSDLARLAKEEETSCQKSHKVPPRLVISPKNRPTFESTLVAAESGLLLESQVLGDEPLPCNVSTDVDKDAH